MGFFPQLKDGECCDCAKQKSACDSCGEDCDKDVDVVLETRARSGYGSRCGLEHPYVKQNPPRMFRRVAVDFSIRYSVTDSLIGGGPGEVAGYYDSRCDLSAAAAWCDGPDAHGTWSGDRRTNFWSGKPVLTNPSDIDTKGGNGSGVLLYPWFADEWQDCWSANQMLGYSSVGEPVRVSGGSVVGGILTGSYTGGTVAAFVIPPPLLVRATPDSEFWQFTSDARRGDFEFDFEGGGRLVSGTPVRLKRTAKGSCSVTLGEEYTPEALRSEVRASAVFGDWQAVGSDAQSGFTSELKLTYFFQEVSFRFRYDAEKFPKVRIGYRFASPGREGPVQYVFSPGDKVFSFSPIDGENPVFVQLVSASVCEEK